MIRLFVGTDGSNGDLESQAVLEWSVRKYASQDVQITWMRQARKGPWSGWRCGSGRTPFSHFRWSIPAVCGFEGRGIYCDSDFIFMADIAELWNQPIPNVLLSKQPKGRLGKTCCLLFDCAKSEGHVPELDTLRTMPDPQGAMSNYFKGHPELSSGFEGDWNCIDGGGYETLTDPRLKAIHYSRIEHQPHLVKHAIPRLAAEGLKHWYTGPVAEHPRKDLQDLFDLLLVEAIANGFPPERYRVEPFEIQRRDFKYKQSVVGVR